MNIYKKILADNLPKLLSLYNFDSFQSTYGFGDRLYWGWKISDFSNGTMQGGVHSLAIAIKLKIISEEKFAYFTIDSIINAINKIRSRNGSLVEAYSGENSFCVTALVSFDVLSAIKLLKNRISENKIRKYLMTVKPLINFLQNNKEQHAIISNHLATAAAALVLWHEFSGGSVKHCNDLLENIYQNQSEEGWYKEYEGADPGYQTLCTYYLFCIYEITKDVRLLESLRKSANFLKYFVHPDGTIGGLYGSRNTEVYYPAGIIGLSSVISDFASISKHLSRRYSLNHHILPSTIDIGNFTPLINAYAVAALYYEKNCRFIENSESGIPYKDCFCKNFNDAGIYIQSNEKYYAIINYKKGGTVKVFDKKTSRLDCEDGGLFGRLNNKKKFSTQFFDDDIKFDGYSIKTGFFLINDQYMNPLSCALLRLLSLTFFKSVEIGNLFKLWIVRLLMTGKIQIDGYTIRRFEFLKEKLIIHEKIVKPKDCSFIGHSGKSKSIHMASSGYYLPQLKCLTENRKIVEFRDEHDS